jgi:hypothetical protein
VVAESLELVIAACALDIDVELVRPTARIGWTLVDERTDSAERALAQVDRALQDARRAGVAAGDRA